MHEVWHLQEGLSFAGYGGLRAEGRENKHFNVHAMFTLRGDVPLQGMLESENRRENGFQISKLVGTIEK